MEKNNQTLSYDFKDLNKKAQERAIENRRNQDYIWDNWWEFLFEDFDERLKEIGVECKTFHFDFYQNRYIQMSEPNITDYDKFLTAAGYGKELILLSLSNLNRAFEIDITYERNKETENRVEFSFQYENEDEIEELLDIFRSNDEDMNENLTSFLQGMLNGFWQILDKEYSYMCSDEYIKDDLMNNDYKFDENGEIQ